MSSSSGWIGIDLDGTLAEYGKWQGVDHIGAPIPLMVARVKRMIAEGINVRIYTARVHGHGSPILEGASERRAAIKNLQEMRETAEAEQVAEIDGQIANLEAEGQVDVITPIQDWCEEHLGKRLPVTNVKDFGMIQCYDDRAVQVEMNTGRIVGDPDTVAGDDPVLRQMQKAGPALLKTVYVVQQLYERGDLMLSRADGGPLMEQLLNEAVGAATAKKGFSEEILDLIDASPTPPLPEDSDEEE